MRSTSARGGESMNPDALNDASSGDPALMQEATTNPTQESESRRLRWAHRVALVVVLSAVALIAVGAMVTSIRSGDTDPTWEPHTFWEWFVTWLKQDSDVGLRYEIGHRIIGAVLGLQVIALTVLMWHLPKSIKPRLLGVLVLLLVTTQGTLGGVRVLVFSTESVARPILEALYAGYSPTWQWESTEMGALKTLARNHLAMGHGALAQVTFTLMAVIWFLTRKRWFTHFAPLASDGAKATRALTLLVPFLLFIQLVFGTYVRQFSHQDDFGIAIHVAIAFGLVLIFSALVLRIYRIHSDAIEVRKIAGLLLFLTLLQIFLGLTPWMLTHGEIYASSHTSEVSILRVAHVLNGAFLLATSTCLAIATCRQLTQTH